MGRKTKNKGTNKKHMNSSYNKNRAVIKPESESNQNEERKKLEQIPPVFAPYNFISLPSITLDIPEDKLPAHNEVTAELISGEIEYKINAKTPIFINDGSDHFYQNGDKCYAIPGSSVRGLIRSNVQILSASSIEDDVDDNLFMYRDVATGSNQKKYHSVLGSKYNFRKKTTTLDNVKVGYIRNENGKYKIYSPHKKMNYYELSEEKAFADVSKNGENSKFKFLVCTMGDKEGRLQNMNPSAADENIVNVYDLVKKRCGKTNLKYIPSFRKISYSISATSGEIDGVDEIGKTGGNWHQGYFLSSGHIENKKVVYIIPEIDDSKEIINLSDEYSIDLRLFQSDYNRRVNNLTFDKDHEYSNNAEKIQTVTKEMISILYKNGNIYLGFTPRLRISYENRIKKGLENNAIGEKLDYSKAIFGYSNTNHSYKSRISFSDAVNIKYKKPEGIRYLTLSEPKPTDYYHYLVQNKEDIVSYNDKSFRLRGIKQYWLHNKACDSNSEEKQNDKLDSKIVPLPDGNKFKGKIRFHNLRKEELGLVLWAIRLEPGSLMNIGQAKGFGYGSIEFKDLELRIFDPEKAYQLDQEIDLNPYQKKEKEDINEYIAIYKKEINALLVAKNKEQLERSKNNQTSKYIDNLNSEDIDTLQSVTELMMMKNGEHMPFEEIIGTMPLESFQKQKKNKENKIIIPKENRVLPSVEEVYNTGY